MFWENVAWAMATPSSPQEGPQPLNPLFLIIPLLLIFWIFMIVPQRRQQKRHQEQVARLKKGDRVLTSGGIYGTVVKNEENSLVLSILEGNSTGSGKKKGSAPEPTFHIRVAKSAISAILEKAETESSGES